MEGDYHLFILIELSDDSIEVHGIYFEPEEGNP